MDCFDKFLEKMRNNKNILRTRVMLTRQELRTMELSMRKLITINCLFVCFFFGLIKYYEDLDVILEISSTIKGNFYYSYYSSQKSPIRPIYKWFIDRILASVISSMVKC